MAHFRKLPSGNWQAIVSLPTGDQLPRTDPLKRVVQQWAADVESDIRRGRWHDHRPAQAMTVADWRAQWEPARMIERITREKDDAHWSVRIEPAWGSTPLAEITRLGLQRWVRAMVDAGTGTWTIHGTVHHFGALLQAALEHIPPLVLVNPVRGLTMPTVGPGRLRWFTHGEVEAILAQLAEPYRTLVDFACYTGLRMGEITGLDVAHIDFVRSEIHVQRVLTKYGLRNYPKSEASNRAVPFPPHLLAPLSALAGDDGTVFRAPEGGSLMHFRARVWVPALNRAGIDYAPPHVMRHTAASWLVMADVSLYKVQKLLGHSSARQTEKYAHLAPDAHEAIRSAWTQVARGLHADDPLSELDLP